MPFRHGNGEKNGGSESVYPELYAVVGSRVPDYQGYFLRGYGGNSASLGVQQGDAIRNITGTSWGVDPVLGSWQNTNPHGYSIWTGAFYLGSENYKYGPAAADMNNALAYFDASRVVPTAIENRPINKAVRYLIRAKS